jgi:hypothetical protein
MKSAKIGYVYRDNKGRRRRYGIFAPGLDRFIHINEYDVWVAMETALVLSSKIPTMTYILHTIKFDFGNHNCLEYTMANKTNQTIQTVSIVNRSQTPSLMFAPIDTNPIEFVGWPEDYKVVEKVEILKRLQEYAEYVSEIVYVCKITDAMNNWMDKQSIMDMIIPDSFTVATNGKLDSMYDRSDAPRGVYFEIRHALYISTTIEEAEQRIIEIWKNCHKEQEFLMNSYYRNLGQEIPEELREHTKFVPIKMSTLLL